MEKTSAQRSGGCAPEAGAPRVRVRIPEPPRSGVRGKPAPEPTHGTRPQQQPTHGIRQLARRAEALGLDPLAFELLFAAARLESGSPVDLVLGQLAETAAIVPAQEARFYRRAARTLATARAE